MNKLIKNELEIYKSKTSVKENWVIKNLPNLYNHLKNNFGSKFSEKVYLMENEVGSCKVCGDNVKFLSISRGYRDYCSKKCSNSDGNLIKKKLKNYKKNNLQKYGVDNPSKLDSVKEKLSKSKSKLDYKKINKKFKESFIEKYGVDNPSKLDSVKEKKKISFLQKYGVNNPFKSEEIKEKIKIINLDNYGVDHPMKSDVIKEKVKETYLQKYGVDNPMKSDLIKEKFKETCLEKYGVNHFYKSNELKEKRKKKAILKHNKYLEKYFIGVLDIIAPKYKLLCHKCNKEFDLYTSTFHIRKQVGKICINCYPIKRTSSYQENILFDFINCNYNDDIIQNYRINNKEIDIFIPDLNIGFEFNGLYWHSKKFKDDNYHLEKLKFFKERGIDILNIWEDDWLYKTDIIKSMILNKIGLVKNKIYARKCEVREITDNKLIREFLTKNHLQGFVGSKIKLGLFYKDELVSLMTFGALRKSLGQKSKDGNYELLRFCSKLNKVVVGGASKIFKHFINNYQFEKIITYSKNDYSSGNLYKNLGFKFESNTVPNYYWVVDGVKSNRFNFRKDKLVREGADPNKTEVEIMNDRGHYRVFDTGNKKWILGKNI